LPAAFVTLLLVIIIFGFSSFSVGYNALSWISHAPQWMQLAWNLGFLELGRSDT